LFDPLRLQLAALLLSQVFAFAAPADSPYNEPAVLTHF